MEEEISSKLSKQNKEFSEEIQTGEATKSTSVEGANGNDCIHVCTVENLNTQENQDISYENNVSPIEQFDGSKVRNEPEPSTPEVNIPDGGFGWIVCFAAMIINGTVFGIINSFGILFVPLVDKFSKIDSSIAFKTSWVGSVCAGVTFLMTMLAGVLCDVIGIRQTGVLGAVLGTIGLVSSAFVTKLEVLYLTFGSAFIFSPSLVILGHYFSRHIGIANGIVAFGNAFFSILMSLALPELLKYLDIKYTFLCLGGLYLAMTVASLTFKPLLPKEDRNADDETSSKTKSKVSKICRPIQKAVNFDLWKIRAFTIWVVSTGVGLFGYFVPFVHLVKHAKDLFPDENGNILITILQITSALSRIVFGKLSDAECVNRIYLNMAAVILSGIVTVCIPFATVYYGLIIIAVILGVTDGIFVFIKGPIAVDIVGPRNVGHAYGFFSGDINI
ncbi:hypothetical protein KUTeg_009440 [Tegillarca granosa]|uniref:Monocarboxylate transporter 10 n=1 Tax=Tegillarca granosa TaxID=220873 RepID=A0ABQ9F3U9_TEGGR|nr:hypothetical protein KUTeg_009440 [Tegillarca granosa]